MTISQTPEEINAAVGLQIKTELIRVALRGCNVTGPNTPTESPGPFVLKISYVSVADPFQSGLLRVSVSFKVEGVDDDDTGSPVEVFGIACSFWLEYRVSDLSFEPSQEALAAFKDGNAVFNCWPYAREFVQNLTARMSINAAPLPFLRLLPKHQLAADPVAEVD